MAWMFALCSFDVCKGDDGNGIPLKVFTREYAIYFKINRWNIDTTLYGNGETIRRMHREIDSLIASGVITADSISIVSAASPDGRTEFNTWLSGKRGTSARNLLNEYYPDISPEIIFINPIGEDWETFGRIVREDGNIPERAKLIELLESADSPEEKERKLRSMKETFRYIVNNHIYLMRAAAVTFNVSMPMIILDSVDMPAPPPLEIKEGAVRKEPVTYQEIKWPETEKKMVLAARTNLLVPALNVGIEVPVGYNWSIGADYYYPWWLAKSNMYCSEMLGWFIDTKYWFGHDRGEKDKLTGHALGAYAGFGYYDYQWERSGNQGEYIDIGVDYTYSIPLAKDRLRMEFNIGLGWVHTVARHYTPTDDYADLIKDPGIRHRKYNFVGPTRASISLVVPIRMKVKDKGGRR